MKVVNLETIIDMQSWCRTWPPSGSNHIRGKQKLLRKHKGACKRFGSPIGNFKPFTQTIHRNLANPVKISPGIIVRRHHTDRKQMVMMKERCAELRKGHLRYCCNQVLMKNGLRIPRNATAICKMFKISRLMAKHFTNGDSARYFKDQKFHLVR